MNARIGGFRIGDLRAAVIVESELPEKRRTHSDEQQGSEQRRLLPRLKWRMHREQTIRDNRFGFDMRGPCDHLVGQDGGRAKQLSFRLAHAEAQIALLPGVEVQRRQFELVLELRLVVRPTESVVGDGVAVVLCDERKVSLRTQRLDTELRPLERQHRDLPKDDCFALEVHRSHDHRVIEFTHQRVRRLRRLDDD